MTGYESKRAAAQDKLDDDDALTIAYQSGYYDGKKAAQPAQKPQTNAEGYLSDLVYALDNAFISSWQSTAAWKKQLDAAKDYLAAHGVKENT
jgi:hypothetical protein